MAINWTAGKARTASSWLGLKARAVIEDLFTREGRLLPSRIGVAALGALLLVGAAAVGTYTWMRGPLVEDIPALDVQHEIEQADVPEMVNYDVVCTTAHVTLNQHPKHIRSVLERGGRVRLLVLDVEFTNNDQALADMAELFGQTPAQLIEEIQYSHSSIESFRSTLTPSESERFLVRAYASRDEAAAGKYLIPCRSYHRYCSNGSKRVDVVVPYLSEDDGTDSPLRKAVVARAANACPTQAAAIETFERIWGTGRIV